MKRTRRDGSAETGQLAGGRDAGGGWQALGDMVWVSSFAALRLTTRVPVLHRWWWRCGRTGRHGHEQGLDVGRPFLQRDGERLGAAREGGSGRRGGEGYGEAEMVPIGGRGFGRVREGCPVGILEGFLGEDGVGAGIAEVGVGGNDGKALAEG